MHQVYEHSRTFDYGNSYCNGNYVRILVRKSKTVKRLLEEERNLYVMISKYSY